MSLYAQKGNSEGSPSKVLPPLPEAASLSKFGNIPVGLYSGVPEISIPIYTIDVKGYSLPISINYHASGIKVEEISSSVGIGWALNAGGMISCTVNGIYDFDNDHGLYKLGSDVYKKYKDGSFNAAMQDQTASHPDYYLLKGLATGDFDGEPDEFNFSFGGKSGKFVFDENHVPRIIPFEQLKIDFNEANNSFQITDDKGVKYIFSAVEQALMQNAPGSTTSIVDGFMGILNYTPTWYLTKIIVPSGDTITFQYENISYSYTFNGTESKYDSQPGSVCIGSVQPADEHSKGIMNVSGGKRISSIESSKGQMVQFIYNDIERLDLPGTYGLKDILVKYNGNHVNSWRLKQDYFNANPGFPESENYRLKLTSIQEGQKAAYTFNYNNSLPPRTSLGQDYWGYYNGGIANLIPQVTLESGEMLYGANREVNPITVQGGMLNKITYPTSGSTEFIYEPNDYYYEGIEKTFEKFETPKLELNGQGEKTYTFTTGNDVSVGRIVFLSNVDRLPPGDAVVATLNGGTTKEYFENRSVFKEILIARNTTYTLTLYSTADEITTSDGRSVAIYAALSFSWSSPITTMVKGNRFAGGIRIAKTIDKSRAGEAPIIKRYLYRNKEEGVASSGYVVNYPVNAFYKTVYSLNPSQPSTYNPPCTYIVRTSNSTSTLSTIKGGSVGYGKVIVLNGENGENGKTVSTFTSYGITSAPPSKGTISGGWPYVYNGVTSYDFLRGLLLDETTYKKISNDFFKTKQVNYHYNISDGISCFLPCTSTAVKDKNVLGLKVFMLKPEAIGIGMGELNSGQFEILAYYHVSSWFYTDSITTQFFDPDENSPLKVSTQYFYNNPAHSQLTSTITKNSKGEVAATANFYPDDYLSGTTFLDDMKANHQIGLPIEQVSYLGTGDNVKITGAALMSYKPGGKLLLDKTYKFENSESVSLRDFKFSNSNLGQMPQANVFGNYTPDNSYRELLIFNKYDSKGNILSLTQKNGPEINYIYSYGGQYPIAEIRNTTYSAIESSLGSTVIENFSKLVSPDKTAIDAFLLPLITSLPNIQVISYVYDPLVGIISQTDAKGMSTYYEYDNLQRLINIKDKDGNIIKNFVYHYAGS